MTALLCTSSTWGQVTAGSDFEVNAGLDDGTNGVWEDVIGTAGIEFTLDTGNGVARVAATTGTSLTHAYDFPGGFLGTDEGGIGGARLAQTGNAVECYSFADGPTPGGWDVQAVSFEIWFKPDNLTPPDGGYILFEDGGGTGLGLFITTNEVVTSQDTDQAVISYNLDTDPDNLLLGPATSEFIQVVLTRTLGGSTNMYVNGQLVGTGEDGDSDWSGGDGFALASRGEANTGGRGNGDGSGIDGTTRSFDGQIALLRVYNDQVLTAGEALANFDALSGPDLTAPTIANLTPLDDETGFFSGAYLVIDFSETIQVGTGNITIKNLDTAASTVIDVADTSQVTIAEDLLTINPTSDLAFGTNYAIQIDAGAVTDQADTPNNFGGIGDDITWNFTTLPQDLTAPFFTGLSPSDDDPSVLPSEVLVVTFDEDIQPGTGNLIIKNLSDETEVIVAVTDESQVSINDAVLTVSPTEGLLGGKNYAVQIEATAVENLSGLAFAGIGDDTTWNFTTLNATTLTATGNWVGGTWDNGEPVPGLNAIIDTDVTATANGGVAPWSGTLALEPGSTLNVLGTDAEFIAVEGATSVAIDDAVLLNNWKSQTVSSDFVLSNGARFNITGNSSWNQDQRFSGVFSGSGGFTVKGGNHQGMRFQNTNTFTGGLTLENQGQRYGVEFSATGAAGAGDVTVEGNADGTGQGAVIIVSALDPFSTSAALTLNSNGFDNTSGGFGPFTTYLGTETRIDMKNDATVGTLYLNNIQLAAGTYTSASGTWIDGTGTLTVLSGTGGSNYSIWIAGFDVDGETGFNEDPDGDGIGNGLENFFGTAPDEASSALISGAVDTGAGTFTFTHPQSATPATDISAAAYGWSTDLITFTASGGENAGSTVTFVATPDPNTDITTVVATVTGTPLTKLFVQVGVSQVVPD